MTTSHFTIAPVPHFAATVALLLAAYSTPVLAMLDAPLAPDVAHPSVASQVAGRAPGAASAPATEGGSEPSDASPRYTCPMHPEIDSDKPGRCPHCGMKLVEKEKPEHGGQP